MILTTLKKLQCFQLHLKLIFGLFLCSSFNLSAQEREISGNISDEVGQPLSGATIVLVNENSTDSFIKGTTADFDGNYKLSVNGNNYDLIISYVGYEDKRVSIGNQTQIDVVLTTNELDEVVLIGYGTTTRRDATGATSTVKQEAIERTQMNSIGEVLEGRVAGLQVTTSDGTPGGGFKINIRGAAGLSASSEPLYVIDGFPYEPDQEANEFNSGYDSAPDNNPLNFIDPNSIESIEVLKDASATAIYGDRGANGVIIITTKSGKIGKPRVQFNTSVALSEVPYDRMLPMLSTEQWFEVQARKNFYDQYRYGLDANGELDYNTDEIIPLTGEFAAYYNEKFGLEQGDDDYLTFNSLDDIRNSGSIGGYTPEERAALPSTNWQDRLFRTGTLASHTLNVSGGTEKNRYNYTGTFLQNKGVVVNSGFDRFAFNAKLKNILTDRLTLSTVLTPSFSKKYGPAGGGGRLQNNWGLFLRVLGTPPYAGADYVDPDEDELIDDEGNQFFGDPLYQAENVENENINYNFRGNMKFEYQLTDDLKATVLVGAGTGSNFVKTYNPPQFGNGGRTQNKGQVIRSSVRNLDYLNNNLLNYKKKLGKHKIDGLLGYTQQYKVMDRLQIQMRGYDEDHTGGANNIQAGTAFQNTRGRYNEQKRIGILSRLNYVYGNKYSFTASYRLDGNSRFGEDNRWGGFPSAAFAWTASNENFLKKSKTINNLKWRVSYGQSGSSGVRNDNSRRELNVAYYNYGEADVTGYENTVNVDPSLTWQRSAQFNSGIDASLFSNRVKFTVDAYLRQTRDMLLEKPLPPSSGFDVRMENSGDIDNWGLEFALNTVNVQANDFSWETTFTIAFDRSEVLDLGGVDFQLFNAKGMKEDNLILKVGENVGNWFGYQQAGIYDESDFDITRDENGYITSMSVKDSVAEDVGTVGTLIGDPKFEDINGDGQITPDDRTIIARAQPDFFGGIYNKFSYKNLSLGIMASFRYGNDVVNGNRWRYTTAQKQNYNTLLENMNAWTPENTNTLHPRYNTIDERLTSRHVEDGSFLRINNISLRYNLLGSQLKKAFFDNIEFSVNLDNFFLITNYSGNDPETSVMGGRYKFLAQGLDYGAYPRTKNVRLGARINF